MIRMIRSKGIVVALAGSLLAVPSGAAAQWNSSAIGVAEIDTEGTLLLLAGVSASPGGMGIAPLIGIQASHLSVDATDRRSSAFTVRPYVGLRSGYNGGSLYGTVGYAFSDRDTDPDPAFAVDPSRAAVAADRGSGVVVSGGLDHWGTGGPLGYQLLGSYNLGSEAYWTRGRVTTRVGDRSPGQMRVGGEVALLGGEGYSAWQPGAIVEFHNGAGRILGLGAGVKIFENDDNAFYFRLEGVLPLSRR